MPREGQYNPKTGMIWSSMTGGWGDPMPGYNVEDDWKPPKGKKKMARYRKRRKGLKLTVRKGKRKWTLRTLFKSKASRMRAKKGLATKGWR